MHPANMKKDLSIFKAYKSSQKLTKPYIPEDGIYMFGGINELGYTCNDLWVLKVGIPRLKWIQPEIDGKAPPPRYGHSMHYVEHMNSIVIFAGRN